MMAIEEAKDGPAVKPVKNGYFVAEVFDEGEFLKVLSPFASLLTLFFPFSWKRLVPRPCN